MRLIFQMILTAFFLFVIGWFVSFQYNPYKLCKDHPDLALRRKFYQCEPGGFDLEKGTMLERSPEEMFPWEKHGDKIIGTNTRIKEKIQKKTKEEDKENKKYNCRPEFYEIKSKDLGKINIDEYCGNKDNAPEVNVEDLGSTGEEL